VKYQEFDEGVPITKVVLVIMGICIAFIAFGWLVQGNNFFMYKFFAPKQEQVRREVYEQTYSYKQGSVQRLNSLCMQINAADDTGKDMLYQVVNQEFASWNSDDVPDYLRSCLATARAKAK
jgi:hypothetical protein